MTGPRIRLGAVLIEEGQLLLVRHRKEARTYWLLPGGGLECGESIAEGLKREVREETGYEAEFSRILALVETRAPDATRHIIHVVALMILGTKGERSDTDPRLDGHEWFRAADLEGLDLRPAVNGWLASGLCEGWSDSATHLIPDWIND